MCSAAVNGGALVTSELVLEAISEIAAQLPPERVLLGNAVTARARNIWDSSPLQAAAVVRPRSTGELSKTLAICNRLHQPVVTHGGRTGVCDGDRATFDDIVISLESMNAIERIDRIGRTVQVQAGCVLQTLQQAVADQDLFLPLDLGARGSCTIGGNVSTNAGGINVIRFGMTRALVLGMEVVLADGTVLTSLNQMIKNNSGYDLKQLFIGSEGTLGVVSRVVLSLEERPVSTNSALLALTAGDHVFQLLKYMDRQLGGMLSSFEVMWGDYYRAVTCTGAHEPILPRHYPFYVVMEMQGPDPQLDTDRFHSALAGAMERGIISDTVLAASERERARIWAVREDFSAIRAFQPQFLYDVSLPLPHMLGYVDAVQKRLLAQWPSCRFYALGHVGDGNLHFFVSPGVMQPNLHELSDQAVYEPLRGIGGAVSAEHGVGLEKKAWLHACRSAQEIETMRLLKRALDPCNILNRGKIFDMNPA